MGGVYFRLGKYQKALEAYEKAIVLNEGFIHFLRFLASADTAVFCHYQLGYLSIVLVGTNFAVY
jgi:tetratricopeptide (TPR) repeat protein